MHLLPAMSQDSADPSEAVYSSQPPATASPDSRQAPAAHNGVHHLKSIKALFCREMLYMSLVLVTSSGVDYSHKALVSNSRILRQVQKLCWNYTANIRVAIRGCLQMLGAALYTKHHELASSAPLIQQTFVCWVKGGGTQACLLQLSWPAGEGAPAALEEAA